MEPVGNIKAQDASGPERVLSINRSSDTQERLKAGDQGQNSRTQTQRSPQMNEAKIERIAEAMDKYVKSVQRDLNIRVNRDTGDVMVKVLSRDTGEVIREIPPEELLKLAARMEEMAGVLFNERA